MEWRTGANRVGWKTAKICITIADRNNYARNAREKGVEEYGHGCKCRRSDGGVMMVVVVAMVGKGWERKHG